MPLWPQQSESDGNCSSLTASPLMIQFLDWIGSCPRSYQETMEAWHTSCPRQSVWEDANIDGLVRFDRGGSGTVVLTAKGNAVLKRSRLGGN